MRWLTTSHTYKCFFNDLKADIGNVSIRSSNAGTEMEKLQVYVALIFKKSSFAHFLQCMSLGNRLPVLPLQSLLVTGIF